MTSVNDGAHPITGRHYYPGGQRLRRMREVIDVEAPMKSRKSRCARLVEDAKKNVSTERGGVRV